MPVSRPTRTDALLGLATFCLVAAAVAAGDTPSAPAAYGFAVGFGALLLVARAWPVPALLATALGITAYYTLDLPPIGLAAPAAAVLYAAAERGRALWAAVVGGALLAASVASRLAEGDDAGIVLGFGLGSEAALMLAVVALGDAVRHRRSLRAELARQVVVAAEERRREAARQVEAERLRIAREVHDTLGHTMSVVTLQSAVAQEALADRAPERVDVALAAIRSAGGSAMAELRATLGTLRGDAGVRQPPPGVDQLVALAEGVRRSGLAVELRVDGDVGALPAVVGTTAYRVVQEALTNALRHARATRVDVTVRATGSHLTLEVVDDGRGAAAPPGDGGGSQAPGGGSPVRSGGSQGLCDGGQAPGGLSQQGGGSQGLRGMSERVALLGGTVHTGTAGTGGFRVSVRLPLSGPRP
ncbi:sensor histidine kinase [Micromonospora sp. NPDC047465]|uniref:sensor histidine kinase n=1 Tax=Micromonospora sp. NPDC047465 TaxID=3154813 RepID=UPI0033C6C979